MKYCPNCKNKIKISNKIKSLYKKDWEIKCNNCGCIYKRKKINLFLIFIVVFIASILSSYITDLLTTSIAINIVKSIIYAINLYIIINISMIIIQRYTKFEEK